MGASHGVAGCCSRRESRRVLLVSIEGADAKTAISTMKLAEAHKDLESTNALWTRLWSAAVDTVGRKVNVNFELLNSLSLEAFKAVLRHDKLDTNGCEGKY